MPPSSTGPEEGDSGAASGTSRKILRASMVVMLAHSLIKILAVIQNRFIGGKLGAGAELDVYSVTFLGVIMTVFLIGEESLGPAFLPLFMEKKDKEDEESAWRFASTIINLQVVLLVFAVAAIMLFPTQILSFFTKWVKPGDAVADERIPMAVSFLRMMAPGLFGLSVASLTYMLLNGYKKFFWAAFGDGTLKAAVILSVVVPTILGKMFPSLGGFNPIYVAVGVLVGSYGKILTHIPGLWRKLRFYRPRVDIKDPQFRRFLLLIAPLLVGILYAKVRDNYNNIRVLSNLEVGLVGIHAWGKKIYDSVGFVIPFAVQIAMFPFFCELVDRNDFKGLGTTVTRSLRVLLFVLLPMSVGIMIVSLPLARGLYQVEEFSYEAARLAGAANAAYTLGLPFIAGEMVLMQAFFSNRRMIAPTIIGMIWSTVSILISYTGIVHYGLTGMGALLCVAGGFAFARACKTATLAVTLGMQVPLFKTREDRLFFLRLLMTTTLVVVLIILVKAGYEAVLTRVFPVSLPGGRRLTLLMLGEVGVCGAAGAAGLVAGGLLFKMEELRLVINWTRERLARRRQTGGNDNSQSGMGQAE